MDESVDSGTTPASLSLVSSANPADPYTVFNFTAKLTHNRTQPIDNDQVTLTIDGAAVSQKTTNAQGTVEFPMQSGLAPGQHSVVATSSVEGVYASATASLTETVNQAPSTSTLTVTPTTASAGSPVTLTAAIGGSLDDQVDGITLTPTGTVTFSGNGTALSTVTLANGAATLTTTALPVGADSITCAYSGDANFAPSSCNSVSVTVSLIASSLTVTASANPSAALSPVTFSTTLLVGGSPLSGASVSLSIDNTAIDGCGRDAEGLGGFVDGEAAEEAELYDAALLGIAAGEPGERGVEFEEVKGRARGGVAILVELNLVAGRAFDGAVRAGVVDEDLAHEAGGDGDEVGAVLRRGRLLIDEAKVGFVD